MLKRVEKPLVTLAMSFLLFAGVNGQARADTSDSDAAPMDAQYFLARHQWAEAAKELKIELRHDPRALSDNADLAKALLYLHRRDEAATELQRAIALNRGDRKSWLIDQLRLISKVFISNQDFQTYQDGVDLLAAQRTRNAREKFEQALSSEPNNVEILTRLAQSLLLEKDYAGAVEKLKQAMALDSYEPEIHLWLGRAMSLQGGAGIGELRQAATQLGQSELAPIWLAEALESSGQYGQAIQVLELDVKNNPIHVGALVELAQLKIKDAGAGSESEQELWSARKNLKDALSRLSDYEQPGRRRFEGELGVQILRSSNDLREQIRSDLQKLESRLEVDS